MDPRKCAILVPFHGAIMAACERTLRELERRGYDVRRVGGYLAEDYAFCQRARQAGFRIMGDTTIRLWHVGNYTYGWEDAGMTHRRFASFTLNFPDQLPPGQRRKREPPPATGEADIQTPPPDAPPEPTGPAGP